jgi:hypothetical protein
MIQDVWAHPDEILGVFGDTVTLFPTRVKLRGNGYSMSIRIYDGSEHPLARVGMCIVNMGNYRDVISIQDLKNRLMTEGKIK